MYIYAYIIIIVCVYSTSSCPGRARAQRNVLHVSGDYAREGKAYYMNAAAAVIFPLNIYAKEVINFLFLFYILVFSLFRSLCLSLALSLYLSLLF